MADCPGQLKVGVASYEDMKARTMAVARGSMATERSSVGCIGCLASKCPRRHLSFKFD